MSKPAISKHVKVLEETGVVTRAVVGRTHRLSLDTYTLGEAADWMDRQRALWGRLFDVVDEYLKEELEMKMPPIVSPQEWEAAREKLLVKEKELTRARDALAAERRRMPRMAVEKEYRFEGPDGPASLLDLFEGRRQLIVYRFFFEPGVAGWPEGGCPGCSMVADQVAHPAHLNARDTTLAFVSRAPRADIERWKARMGWEIIPWYTLTDDFDADFDVDEWHGTNAFFRDEETGSSAPTSSTAAATRSMGGTWSYLDITALGRQEEWEDSPEGYPQTPTYHWWKRHDEYDGSEAAVSAAAHAEQIERWNARRGSELRARDRYSRGRRAAGGDRAVDHRRRLAAGGQLADARRRGSSAIRTAPRRSRARCRRRPGRGATAAQAGSRRAAVGRSVARATPPSSFSPPQAAGAGASSSRVAQVGGMPFRVTVNRQSQGATSSSGACTSWRLRQHRGGAASSAGARQVGGPSALAGPGEPWRPRRVASRVDSTGP